MLRLVVRLYCLRLRASSQPQIYDLLGCVDGSYGSEAVNPQYVVIRLGCVAERAQLPPRKQIWTRSAMPWIHDLENVPAFAEGS